MKKNLREKVLNFVDSKNLNYFISSDEELMNCLLLPYRTKDIEKLIICIEIYSELNMLKIGFRENMDCNTNLDEIKTKLLDLNSKLILGNLALEKSSNKVSFLIDWIIESKDEISEETYNKHIAYVITVYKLLLEEKIIMQTKGI